MRLLVAQRNSDLIHDASSILVDAYHIINYETVCKCVPSAQKDARAKQHQKLKFFQLAELFELWAMRILRLLIKTNDENRLVIVTSNGHS